MVPLHATLLSFIEKGTCNSMRLMTAAARAIEPIDGKAHAQKEK